jgi:hypothetical protein
MVGLVIARARHTAKVRAKKGCFTAYLALKGCVKAKTVCPRTERLSVPVTYFQITTRFEPEPAGYNFAPLSLAFTRAGVDSQLTPRIFKLFFSVNK